MSFGGTRLIDDRQGNRAPNGDDGLAFRHYVIKDNGLLSWGHQRCERGFLWKIFFERFCGIWKGDLECRNPDLNESNNYGSDFLSKVIGRLILTTNNRSS